MNQTISRREVLGTMARAGMSATAVSLLSQWALGAEPEKRPNILYIMADDHAPHALSCYGSVLNTTPNLDRIAKEGVRFERCFVTNSLCGPSRACLLTGKYNAGVPKNSRLDAPGMEWLRDLILKQPGIEKKLAAVPKFAAIAGELGTSLPRLAIAWCLKNPQVSTVILGASRVEQLTENLGALDLVEQLTPAVMKRLDAISKPVAD